MNKLLKVFLLLVFLNSCSSTKKKSLSNNSQQNSLVAVFPDDYMGRWEGVLEIFNQKGKSMEVPMGFDLLELAGSEHLTFRIRYGEDKPESYRNYELITLDKEKGLFKVDEKNSILLEAYYLGGTFFQTFEVGGNLLTSAVRKSGEQLIWEITSGSLEPVNITGGVVHHGEEIPEVKSYATLVFQRGILTKKQ